MDTIEIRNAWEIKALTNLPGATTSVGVSFAGLSTRMKNSILRNIEAYQTDLTLGQGGYYSKAKELFRYLRQHCGIPQTVFDGYHMKVVNLNEEQWAQAVDLIKADVMAARLTADKKYQIDQLSSILEELELFNEERTFYHAYQDQETMPQMVRPFQLQLAQQYQKQYAEQYQQMQDIVTYGGTIHFEYIR